MNSENTSDKNQVKALNKTDIKCRFFAQYWGQKVVAHTEYLGIEGIKDIRYEPRTVINFKEIETSCLVLKPLSKITDEDVEELLPLVSCQFSSRYTDKQIKEEIKKSVIDTEMMPLEFTDWLRSKGYALPFMEYSVENLISFGWVQLV